MYSEYVVDRHAPGEAVILYSAPSTKRTKTVRRLGIAFILLSLLVPIILFSPAILMEINYRFGVSGFHVEEPAIASTQKPSPFGELLWLDSQKIDAPDDWNYSLIIPKIGVNSVIIPEVDPVNKEIYNKALEKGVAHARGTSYPDKDGSTYIFGHSSTFLWETNKPIFYLLKNLTIDDQILVFYKGQRYVYKVTGKDIKNPEDIPDYVNQVGEKLLVLQTCYPPGTAWKRLFIKAELI